MFHIYTAAHQKRVPKTPYDVTGIAARRFLDITTVVAARELKMTELRAAVIKFNTANVIGTHHEVLEYPTPQNVNRVKELYDDCRRCHLCHHRTLVVHYKGSLAAKVVAIGEGPGRAEDARGQPFIGPSGRLQDELFTSCGINPFNDVAWVNLVGCFTADTSVSSPHIQRGYRRWYEGPLVKVETRGAGFPPDSGRRGQLSGTPNHPVLTTRGWVPLGALVKGDHLVCCTLREGVGARDPHVEHGPSRFDKLFRALALEGVCEGVPGTDMDFHGDGFESNVEVVSHNRLLVDGVNATGFQHFHHDPLKAAHNAFSEVLFPRPCLRPFLACGRISGLTTDSVVGCFSKAPAAFRPNASHPYSHGFRFIADVDSHVDELLFQPAITDPKLVRERLKSLASNVSFDEVVDVVEDRFFRGHVYNLQTSESWYTANGVLVSNCRPCENRAADDRAPTLVEKLACSEHLLMLLRIIRPRVVLCLGKQATSMFWDEPPCPNSWHPFALPDHPDDWIYVGALRHPAYLLRSAMPNYKELFAARIALMKLKTWLPTLTKVREWRFGLRYMEGVDIVVGGHGDGSGGTG